MKRATKNFDIKKAIDHKRKVEAAQPAEGRTSLYNPLLQKPVSLEPVGPGSYPAGLGGYAYIGPPADFGGSYGCYVDASGRKQYGVKSSKQFSIYDGSPVQLHNELSAEEREALLSQMDEIHEEAKCESCRAELSVSAPIQAETIHCPYCSSEMSSAVEKVKQCYSKLEEKTMQKQTKEAVKAEADLAKEAMKMEAPGMATEDMKAPKAAELCEPSIEKDASNMEVMKEVTEPKETKVKASEDAAKVEAAAQKRRERIEAARKAFQEKKRKAALSSLRKQKVAKAVKASKKEEIDHATKQELKKELRIMATFQPEKFIEVSKNPRLAAICAEVTAKLYTKEERKQVRAELAMMASEDPEAHEKAKQELEFIAPEILMEQDEMAPPPAEMPVNEPVLEEKHEEKHAESAKDEEHKEEEKHAEASEEEMEEQHAEAMKTEYLASLSSLKGEKIEMSLYGEESANPFWNVVIDAEPVGRIYLGDQENAEQIRAGFMADSYATNFGTAVNQVGLEKMLTLANARLFAHQIDNSETLSRVKAKAKAEAKAEFDEKMQTLRQDFMTAVHTAVMASDKNMYQSEEGHALKGGLFTALANLSIDPQHAVWAIEAGFENAPAYFDFITQKAIEIMDMPVEARASFESIVKQSGKMEIAAGEQPEEESLRDRLVKASHSAVAMGGLVGGEDKDMIRQNLKLSPNRR